jgi:hypothetical protein
VSHDRLTALRLDDDGLTVLDGDVVRRYGWAVGD